MCSSLILLPRVTTLIILVYVMYNLLCKLQLQISIQLNNAVVKQNHK